MKHFLSMLLIAGAITTFSHKVLATETPVDFDQLISAEDLAEQMADEIATEDTVDQNTVDSEMLDGVAIPRPRLHVRRFHPAHRVFCFATDFRGFTYRAAGRNPFKVQHKALNKCFQMSRGCVARGCHH